MGTVYGVATPLPLGNKIHEDIFLEVDVVLPMYSDDIATVGHH